ncbi:hypothetical protein Tco_1065843, partial [Tanacetum coccineum]
VKRAKSVAVLELIYPPKEALSVIPCRSCPELYKSRVLELNASDDRGINVVRTIIKNFAVVDVGSAQHGYYLTPFI